MWIIRNKSPELCARKALTFVYSSYDNWISGRMKVNPQEVKINSSFSLQTLSRTQFIYMSHSKCIYNGYFRTNNQMKDKSWRRKSRISYTNRHLIVVSFLITWVGFSVAGTHIFSQIIHFYRENGNDAWSYDVICLSFIQALLGFLKLLVENICMPKKKSMTVSWEKEEKEKKSKNKHSKEGRKEGRNENRKQNETTTKIIIIYNLWTCTLRRMNNP